MPGGFNWYDQENAIGYCRMFESWTWDQFFEVRQAFRDKYHISELERVDLIWEITHDAAIPTNFVSVLKSAIGSASKNWNITVVVNPGPLLKSLFGVIEKTNPEIYQRYPFARTYEEAREMILRHRNQQAND